MAARKGTGLIPRWARWLIVLLVAIVVISTGTDSIVIVVALNRIVQLQHEVCMTHVRVKTWEDIASAKLRIHPPLLGSEPSYCPIRPG
jgi:hypothetical protein